jgi:hypothetical protein
MLSLEPYHSYPSTLKLLVRGIEGIWGSRVPDSSHPVVLVSPTLPSDDYPYPPGVAHLPALLAFGHGPVITLCLCLSLANLKPQRLEFLWIHGKKKIDHQFFGSINEPALQNYSRNLSPSAIERPLTSDTPIRYFSSHLLERPVQLLSCVSLTKHPAKCHQRDGGLARTIHLQRICPIKCSEIKLAGGISHRGLA